ncbi:MAG: hypothetical protein KDE27_00250, partial [Planctomycetes bacterium]|nr:hypothetical protein [Planctomycetota bacterium]
MRLVEAAGVDEPGAHALPDGCVRVALGRGRDRPFALTQIGERCGGANGPRYVARIEGALGGPSVGGRWAVLALRPDVRAADVAIESDCEMVAGSPAWRMVPAPPLDDPPALHLPRRAGFEPCCLADALEFEAFWRRFGEGAPA